MNAEGSAGKRGAKSASAFRTISEVSKSLDVPQHVLRFWESKFNQVKPLKRAGGRRYYRPEDMLLLQRIRDLLYAEGYTIKGVQKLLREKGVKVVLTGESTPMTVSAAPAKATPAIAGEDGQHDLVDAIAAVGGHTGGEKGMTTVERMELRSIYDELSSIHGLLRERLDA
ncbi:MerR family transcriptional regulator [Aestuariispira insulae]|uniref:MerR-like DNA binding protein n=1 Tax=Aestuariispira insulae TaxID=1461337 RepID=A0A3D9HV23_9PROT|nr:MerR family transcriptional regulator [Aestuariispira insulae]RED53363.1 MerR-like DNA binding protein [Aestuariispira insulae]